MWLLSNKVKVEDSGLLEGFRDCHCHLLPGVDDGVKELHETLKILERWKSLGVKEVWLTPHIMEDIPNKTQELKEKCEELKSVAPKDITLRLAAENMMDNLFLKRLDERDLIPLGEDRKYLLVGLHTIIHQWTCTDSLSASRKVVIYLCWLILSDTSIWTCGTIRCGRRRAYCCN